MATTGRTVARAVWARQRTGWPPEKLGLIAILLGVDALAIGSAFTLAYAIRFQGYLPFFQMEVHPSPTFYRSLVLWLIPVWLLIFAVFHLYNPSHLLGGTREYSGVVNASTLGMMVVVFATFVEPGFVIARGWLLLSWFLVIVFDGLSRFGVRRAVYYLRSRGHFMRPTVIVGAGAEGQAIAEQLLSAPRSGLQIIGFLDDSLPVGTEAIAGVRVLGSTDAIERLVVNRDVAEVILVPNSVPRKRLLEIYQNFGSSTRVNFRLASGLFEILTTGMTVSEFGNVPLLTMNKVRLTTIDTFLKSVLDYSVALFGLVLLSPVFLVIAILIKLDSRGPVFYRRRVVGMGGLRFDAFKFRTMVSNADALLRSNIDLYKRFEGNCKLVNDPRVTRIGGFLRRTSLDELPQLLNVLRGEMGLVGPRMITPEELRRYGKWETNLLTVKPGITGLWQVSGRSDLSYDERVNLDMYYIRNYSIWFDLRILFRTIPAAVRGHGAY